MFHFNLQAIIQLLATLSVITFTMSIICIPILVARLPQNYFQFSAKIENRQSRLSPLAIPLLILRNIVGVLLTIAGIAMLFLPGQGVLTMVIGLALMDFPFKINLLKTLTRPASVRNGLNWIRKKAGCSHFDW